MSLPDPIPAASGTEGASASAPATAQSASAPVPPSTAPELVVVNHPLLRKITGVRDNPRVESFYGVPYGEVRKRWTQAQFVTLLDGLQAVKPGPRCPQPPSRGEAGCGPPLPHLETELEEDEFRCLNVNITRPVGYDDVFLPVMVWIHGGGFNVGSASEPIHNPVAFVEWSASQGLPVIAVGVNYRLGPFGFLYSSDLDGARSAAFRGNFGLRDQRMALDWIHRNIEGFGGDSDRITIVGQSAGGYAIHAQLNAQTHYNIPPLFARAIVQSGPLADRHVWSIHRLDLIWAKMVKEAAAQAEAALPDTPQERIDSLRAVSAAKLIELGIVHCKVSTWGVFHDGAFVPPEIYHHDGTFREAKPKVEALILGDVADERSVFLPRAKRRGKAPLLHALHSLLSSEDAAKVEAAYKLDQELSVDELTVQMSYAAQDMRYLYPGDALAKAWPSAIRYHISLPNTFEEAGRSYKGMAHHSIDVMYLFRNYNRFFTERGMTTHTAVSDAMGRAWLLFMHGGEPWEHSARQGAHFGKRGMEIVQRDKVKEDEEEDRRLALWSSLGLVTAGRVANVWISEENDRVDAGEAFVP